MVAYANLEAYCMTLETHKATYYSTSRNELWVKGESSGNYQKVVNVLIDCDGDALVYRVVQIGEGACHTNAQSCFFRSCLHGNVIMDVPNMTEDDTLPIANLKTVLKEWKSAAAQAIASQKTEGSIDNLQ